MYICDDIYAMERQILDLCEVTDLSDINACEAHPSFEFAGSSYEGRTDSEFVNIC